MDRLAPECSDTKKANKTAADLEQLKGKPLFWFPVECNSALLKPWHFVAGEPPKTLDVMIKNTIDPSDPEGC